MSARLTAVFAERARGGVTFVLCSSHPPLAHPDGFMGSDCLGEKNLGQSSVAVPYSKIKFGKVSGNRQPKDRHRALPAGRREVLEGGPDLTCRWPCVPPKRRKSLEPQTASGI